MIAVALLLPSASALVVRPAPLLHNVRAGLSPTMVATSTSAKALTAERYIATNRFRVKDSREAAFEKRWADRQSRLGMLDGFRFFCMLRRVARSDGKPYDDDINYISCTVWEGYDDFMQWKTGDAFKEAHGGGTVGGIASMLLATARNTKGKPKAAMWEGLLPVSMGAGKDGGGAWSSVVADGVTTLEGECFVAMNRFTVSEGSEAAFEERFAGRESNLATFAGFKGFLLFRRDGADPDGFNYSTWSVWKDRESFEGWKNAQGGGEKKSGGPPQGGAGGGGPPSIYAKPPVPAFYEGILMLESEQGI